MTETETETPPPPPPDGGPDAPPGRPPLVRRRRGRMLAGVAMGLSRHLGIDVTLVRIGFVVLAFIGGTGILAYVAGWVLLPERRDLAAGHPGETERGVAFWLGIGLLVVAAVILVEHTTPFGSGVGTPLVLIAAGIALWKVSQDRAPDRPVPPPPSDGGTAAATQPMPASPAGATADDWTPPPVPPRSRDRGTDWTPPPAPPRTRSLLGRVTVALVLIAVGGGFILDELDLARFTALDAAATALLLTGVGLVVGTWFGRARGLIVLGIVLIPFVVAASLLHGTGIDVRDGAGERVHHVTASTGIESEYSLGAGSIELDLTEVELPPGDTRTDVRMGAGEVLLLVPEDTSVVIRARVHVGSIRLPDQDRAGAGLTERLVLGSDQASAGTLHIDVELGAGELVVRLVPTPEDRP